MEGDVLRSNSEVFDLPNDRWLFPQSGRTVWDAKACIAKDHFALLSPLLKQGVLAQRLTASLNNRLKVHRDSPRTLKT